MVLWCPTLSVRFIGKLTAFLSCLHQIIQTPGLWETTGRNLRLDADSGPVGSSCYCVVWPLYPVGDDDTTMRTLSQTLQNLAIMSFMLRWRKHDAWSITRLWWGWVGGESVCVCVKYRREWGWLPYEFWQDVRFASWFFISPRNW